MDLLDQIKEARGNFETELSQAATDAALQAVRNRYLARDKGVIAAIMNRVAAAPPDVRPACGRAANELKTTIERFHRILTRSFEAWVSSSEQCAPERDRSGNRPPIRRIHHVQ